MAVVTAVVAIAFWHMALPAHAGGFLDGLQDTVQNVTGAWMDRSLQLATVLFSIMMTVTLVSTIARYASINHTLEGFGHTFMDLFIKVIPLYVIMAASTTFLPNIVNFANGLGGQITGTPVNGPSEIFGIGITLSTDVLKAALLPFTIGGVPVIGDAAMVLGLLTGCIGLVMALILTATFALIAFEYFFAFAQAFITLSVGAISLGWLASSGTKQMGEMYLAGAWLSVMRLVVTIAVVGFIVAIVPHMTELAATGDPKTIIRSWIALAGSSLFAALMATKIPAFASNLFSGQPAVSAAQLAGSVIRTGAAVGRTAISAAR